LEQLPSAEASVLLRKVKGIGPWTASLILLRGLGRLDVFPANDSSVTRNLMLLGGPSPLELETLLNTLGSERGLLYYHLLLGRLEARGDLAFSAGEPSGTGGRA
jgi:DNA-3-methyladenine glycosylase II